MKIGVTIRIHARFNKTESCMLPLANALVTVTAFVSGRKICAAVCTNSGIDVKGKKVPLKRNIGVMKRKLGKLKESMFGTMAVKHIAIDENRRPTRNERGGIRRDRGVSGTPNIIITPRTIVELIRLFVAPHKISPVITSSMLTGVAIIASNVF